MKIDIIRVLLILGNFYFLSGCGKISDRDLIGYWDLEKDVTDRSGHAQEATVYGHLEFDRESTGQGSTGFAIFNGEDRRVEISTGVSNRPEDGDFTVSVWVNLTEEGDEMPGDIISQYDPSSKKGFHLSVKTNTGTNNTANKRKLSFSVDDDAAGAWKDEGKPGNALLAFGLTEYKGDLYAGTCEPEKDEFGHVYRYIGDGSWEDCGFPDSSNAVMALTVFDGNLYAGTGHYRTGGSSLPDSENTRRGGRIFRYDSGGKWTEIGDLDIECVQGMIEYKGKLYVSSLYSPGFFRYDGDGKWTQCENPGKRVNSMGVHRGYLYATSYDGGRVYRYEGNRWADCGQVGDPEVNTQTYSFSTYRGEWYVATWRSGRVYRFDGMNQWTDAGRLGEELEVMGMMVHNGRFLAGSLPLGAVFSYEEDTTWHQNEQLDKTPDVVYRRVWTFAEHDGKIFASALPSGKIFSFEAGKTVDAAEAFPDGWHHVTAVKSATALELYLDGALVNRKKIPDSVRFNLDHSIPLNLGFGMNDYFSGNMKALRLYGRTLDHQEIKRLSREF